MSPKDDASGPGCRSKPRSTLSMCAALCTVSSSASVACAPHPPRSLAPATQSPPRLPACSAAVVSASALGRGSRGLGWRGATHHVGGNTVTPRKEAPYAHALEDGRQAPWLLRVVGVVTLHRHAHPYQPAPLITCMRGAAWARARARARARVGPGAGAGAGAGAPCGESCVRRSRRRCKSGSGPRRQRWLSRLRRHSPGSRSLPPQPSWRAAWRGDAQSAAAQPTAVRPRQRWYCVK